MEQRTCSESRCLELARRNGTPATRPAAVPRHLKAGYEPPIHLPAYEMSTFCYRIQHAKILPVLPIHRAEYRLQLLITLT